MAKHPTRKDRHRPRRGSKSFDPTCRNNNACNWCRSNRTIREQRERLRTDMDYEMDPILLVRRRNRRRKI